MNTGSPTCKNIDKLKIVNRLKSKTNIIFFTENSIVVDPDQCFWASRVQIRILPFSHKDVERTEIMLAK
jgi:hypothetical protein